MQKKQMILISSAALSFSIVFFMKDIIASRAITEYTLERNTPGEGTRDETLEYELSDGTGGEVTLTIPEGNYKLGEVERFLEQALQQLDQHIIGDNKSWNHISHNLNLVSSVPDSPVNISWISSRTDILDYDGNLSDKIPNEGVEITLDAELSLQGKKEHYQRAIKVYPPEASSLSEELKQTAEKSNENLEGNQYLLPETLNGKRIIWKYKISTQGVTLLFLTLLGISAAYIAQKQEASQLQERCREQMMLDYPDIISKFLLLLSAGLSIRNCFERIALDYNKLQKSGTVETHAVYEEIVITCHEIKSGLSEQKAYESFGKRCDCSAYKTLATLLSQSLKKGSKGIMDLLEREAQDAFEDRKRRARIIGDKAGTKLLIPMIMMFAIVLVLLFVPAYLSFSL